MSIRVAVVGSNGKMGKEAVKAIQASPDLVLATTITRNESLEDKLIQSRTEIAVDLTEPSTIKDHLFKYIELSVSPVVGTTGLSEDSLLQAQDLSKEKELGGLIAPNFAVGAVLMMEFAKKAANYIEQVEIVEMHHPQKLDRPSGTALKTALDISQVQNKKPEDIPIHSLRLDGYIASQEISFGQTGERLSIRHDTMDRQCFMPGIVLACKKVRKLDRLLVGLENLL